MVEDFMNEVFQWDVVKHGSVDVIQALISPRATCFWSSGQSVYVFWGIK